MDRMLLILWKSIQNLVRWVFRECLKNYNLGIKMIENSIKKKQFALENKKLIKYGKKILNLTYLKIIKSI